MDPLIIAGLAINVLREAMLEIERRVQAGQISVEAQQDQIRKIDAIRAGNFDGPEWRIEPDPPVSGAPQPFPDATKPFV